MKLKRPLPKFANEDAERLFWARHDSADYLDWRGAQRVVFPNLKTPSKTISLRLPASMLHALKSLANRRDVPYQSLLKVFLADRIAAEFRVPPTGTTMAREATPVYGKRTGRRAKA